MNRQLLSVLTLLLFQVGIISGQSLSYKDKYGVINSQRNKYPEDIKFSDKYLKLTEGTIDLVDSVLTDFMKSIKSDPFDYLSHDIRVAKIYERLKEIHDLGYAKIQKSIRRELINRALQSVATSKDFREWISNEFKDKLQVESLSEMRQIQTSCYETINIVFDDIIENQK